MARQVPTDHKISGEEVYKGSKICREKTMELLKLVGLPNDLILVDDIQEVLDDIQECRYDKTTGRVLMKRDKKVEHEFKAIGRLVQYDTEISGYVEQHKMKKVSGVKIKDWITISEISIDPASAKICFKGDIKMKKGAAKKRSNTSAILRGSESPGTETGVVSNTSAILRGSMSPENKERDGSDERDRVITVEMRFSVGA